MRKMVIVVAVLAALIGAATDVLLRGAWQLLSSVRVLVRAERREVLMRRTLVGLALASALAVVLLIAPGAAVGGRPVCLVSNERSDVEERSLQTALDAAVAGDTLVVKGTCVGTTTIAKSITLKGVSNPSFGVATLDGNGVGTTLTVAGPQTVDVGGLLITGGSGSVQGGGGIRTTGGATLTLVDSTITGNTSSGSGGGIFTQNGTILVVMGTTISGNTSTFPGGGIFSFNGGGGTVLVEGSLIAGNTTQSSGGGISYIFGPVTLHDSVVIGNTAAVNGGGVYASGGTFTLSGSSLVRANTAGSTGGGIFWQSGATLVGCVAGVNVVANVPNDIAP
jgi:predicted outer membrane repeat protein